MDVINRILLHPLIISIHEIEVDILSTIASWPVPPFAPDNMPVTWCYVVDGGNVFCATGHPVGCFVDATFRRKDACVMDVRMPTWLSY